MAKVKVRTKQGEFIDDLHHFTTKWQEMDEAALGGRDYASDPNIEVQSAAKAEPKEE